MNIWKPPTTFFNDSEQSCFYIVEGASLAIIEKSLTKKVLTWMLAKTFTKLKVWVYAKNTLIYELGTS